METITTSKKSDLLKVLAIFTMLIDHIGYMFFPEVILYRIIGRLAFPIFAYLIAAGYSRTSNLKKYIARLSIFAIITQVPYSFFNPNLSFNPYHLNVLFAFVVAIALIYSYDHFVLNLKHFLKENKLTTFFKTFLFLNLTWLILVAPEIISFIIKGFSLEYGILGFGLVLLFHIFSTKKAISLLSIILLYALSGYYKVVLLNSSNNASFFWSHLFNFNYVWNMLNLREGLTELRWYYFNAWGILAWIPIVMFDKIESNKFRLNKYIGYVFYPAHITILISLLYASK